MKKILCAFMVLGFCYSYAGDDLDICKSWSEIAGDIMNARQKNLPMYEHLELVEDVFGGDEKALIAARKMVLMAY